jgi:hypothetical protein
LSDNPLIFLETAKEKVWNFLGISLEKLGISLEKLGNPWKGLEKRGAAVIARSPSEARGTTQSMPPPRPFPPMDCFVAPSGSSQ